MLTSIISDFMPAILVNEYDIVFHGFCSDQKKRTLIEHLSSLNKSAMLRTHSLYYEWDENRSLNKSLKEIINKC